MFRFARAIRLRNLIACCTFMNLFPIRSVAVNERNPLNGWSVILLLLPTNSRRRLMKNNFIRSGKTGYGVYATPSWRSTWETLEKITSIFCRECYFSLPRLVSRICRHLTSHNHIISAHLLLVYNIEKTKRKMSICVGDLLERSSLSVTLRKSSFPPTYLLIKFNWLYSLALLQKMILKIQFW